MLLDIFKLQWWLGKGLEQFLQKTNSANKRAVMFHKKQIIKVQGIYISLDISPKDLACNILCFTFNKVSWEKSLGP